MALKDEEPMVSCICITKNRPKQLQRVIECFKLQSYESKELLVVVEEDDIITQMILKLEFEKSVKTLIVTAKKYSLGELRNLAIEKSSGEYICQWDDDDWYHVGRLEFQMEVIKISGKRGCVLSKWVIFDQTSSTAYISVSRLWEGSILCEKEILLQHRYADKNRGEDCDLIKFLYQEEYLYLINEVPNLYIYVFHGNNTWDYPHFKEIFDLSEYKSFSFSMSVKKILTKQRPTLKDSLNLDKLLNIPIFQ